MALKILPKLSKKIKFMSVNSFIIQNESFHINYLNVIKMYNEVNHKWLGVHSKINESESKTVKDLI